MKKPLIAPTSPQAVYVPQYAPQQVYPQTFGLDVTDLLVGGAITFGAVSLIDEIFDDDDDWDDEDDDGVEVIYVRD